LQFPAEGAEGYDEEYYEDDPEGVDYAEGGGPLPKNIPPEVSTTVSSLFVIKYSFLL
jgi:hypothetical protein